MPCRVVPPSGPWLCPADSRSSCMPERDLAQKLASRGPALHRPVPSVGHRRLLGAVMDGSASCPFPCSGTRCSPPTRQQPCLRQLCGEGPGIGFVAFLLLLSSAPQVILTPRPTRRTVGRKRADASILGNQGSSTHVLSSHRLQD